MPICVYYDIMRKSKDPRYYRFQTFELVIEKLITGGAGMGRFQGKVVFVPFTAPGDVVRARTVREARDFIEAELLEVIKPSEKRTEPASLVFGKCGGCQWQHIQYPFELRAKEEIFLETLRRLGRIGDVSMDPPIPAQEPLGSRSRVRLQVRGSPGRRTTGFYRARSAEVVDVEYCPCASPWINALLPRMREFLNATPSSLDIYEAEVTAGETGAVTLLFRTRAAISASRAQSLLDKAMEMEGVEVVSVVFPGALKIRGDLPILYRLPMNSGRILIFRVSPLAFIQASYSANRALVRTVLTYAQPLPSDVVLDLYCGIGNFSLPLACIGGKVMGVDQNIHAIRCARLNARENGMENVHFIRASAREAVESLSRRRKDFRIVVLDPPRTGARRIVERLGDLQPERIVYVSCDPATLARDLRILASAGYSMVRATVVDMFPHTHHIESVILLSRV